MTCKNIRLFDEHQARAGAWLRVVDGPAWKRVASPQAFWQCCLPMQHTALSAAFIFALASACTTSAAAPSPATPPASAAAPAQSTPPTEGPAPAPAPTPSKAGPAGAMCGGIAGFGCASGLYCAFPLEAHCGAADQSGVCKPVSEMCTEQFDPVCGCNDKTYPNECYAAREGISVASKGECAKAASLAEGQLCGTRGVPGECAEGLYCKFKSACGATDAGGTCVKRPQMCTKIYRPVCGCNGKTYGSDCVAAGQGISIAHDGACKGSP